MSDEELRQQIIAEYEELKRKELSEKMAALGRKRSPAKTKAARKNAKLAVLARKKGRKP